MESHALATRSKEPPELNVEATPPPEELAPYDYTRLHPSKKEVRLFRILDFTPGSPGRLVSVKLIIASLDEQPDYVCFSYVWGDPGQSQQIIVDGRTVSVPVSLEAALRRCRDEFPLALSSRVGSQSQLYWADSIFIDQTNLDEKATQVRLMAEIYTSCRYALGWLGSLNNADRLAISTMNYITLELSPSLKSGNHFEWSSTNLAHVFGTGCILPKIRNHLDSFTRQDASPIVKMDRFSWESLSWPERAWIAVQGFFHSEYWARIWIVQEMTLAPTLHLLSKDLDIGLEQIQLFYEFLLWLSSLQRAQRPTTVENNAWRVITCNHSYTRALLTHKYTIRHDSSAMNATDILLFSLRRRCHLPHDNVFGILGIIGLPIQIDYERSVREVYSEWCRNLLSGQSGFKLDILKYAGIGITAENSLDLPTWLVNLHTLPDLGDRVIVTGRHFKTWDPRRQDFTNSHGVQGPTISDEGALRASGVVLCSVSVVDAGPSSFTDLCIEVLTWTHVNSGSTLVTPKLEIWRAL